VTAELIGMPERADLVALVEVLLGWSAFSSKEGIIWLDGDQLTFGAWHAEDKKRSSDHLEKVFQAPMREVRWKWHGSLDELHVWVADKRYRVKFQGETEWSATVGDAAASIDLPALKIAAIADQIMAHRRLKDVWRHWKPVLESFSGPTV
jgi:hypothetical protein